jgi:hypothetical protein
MGGDLMAREWDVPGYTGVKVLGSGGFGEVVLARHDASGTLVAIKYLRGELVADAGFAALFRAEAAVLASLDDPNVVRLYEYVESPSGAAIVMELVDGVSLRDILAQEGKTTAEAALVVLQGSLLGLAAAHRRGVVHRDYKPENVLIDGAGVSKLTDFGIAARAGDSAVPAGTMRYAPPEQFGGAPATPASDVYAATATFYECLTGRPPFTGETAERLLYQHMSEPVPLDPVPEPLRPLVQAGLAKDPAARPADGTALVAELRKVAGWTYGPDWEARGRSALASAALLLAALWPAAGSAAGSAAAQGGSTVHQVRLRRRIRPRHIGPVKAAIAAAGAAVAVGVAVIVAWPTSPAAAKTPVLTGTWTGSYICSQGLTGLRLVVRAARDGTLTGTFSFYALPANPGVPSGEGTITGTYSATSTDIRPGRWIKQPSGYVLVGLIAGPPADNGTLLRGRVSTPGCSTFSVTKSLWLGFRAGGWPRKFVAEEIHQQPVVELAVAAALILAHDADGPEAHLGVGADGPEVGRGRVDGDPVMIALLEQEPGQQPDRLGPGALALEPAAEVNVDPRVPVHRLVLLLVLDAPGDLPVDLYDQQDRGITAPQVGLDRLHRSRFAPPARHRWFSQDRLQPRGVVGAARPDPDLTADQHGACLGLCFHAAIVGSGLSRRKRNTAAWRYLAKMPGRGATRRRCRGAGSSTRPSWVGRRSR